MSVLFVDPVCPAPYSLTTLQQRALGGTEATVIRVAERLDAEVTQHSRTHSEGRYLSYEDGKHADHVVVLRQPAALLEWHARLPHARPYLWLHDLLAPGSQQERELRLHAPALAASGATVICVSEFHRRQALAALQLAQVSLCVQRIYNPIADDLAPASSAFDAHKLLFASQPKKGLEITLLAFRALHAADPRFRLCVANPGYRQFARRTQPGVEWLGELPHARVLAEIGTALCVFYPNFQYPETFGLVFAESNALGTPVLTHDVGAAGEVIQDARQVLPLDARLTRAHRWSRRLPRGPLRRWTVRAGGALGAFARYRDIILDWSNGRRPVVHARDEFRLAQVEAAWRRLLANPEFRSP